MRGRYRGNDCIVVGREENINTAHYGANGYQISRGENMEKKKGKKKN